VPYPWLLERGVKKEWGNGEKKLRAIRKVSKERKNQQSTINVHVQSGHQAQQQQQQKSTCIWRRNKRTTAILQNKN